MDKPSGSGLNILGSRENISYEEKLQVRKLVTDAKLLANEGELHKSLKYFRKAYQLQPTEKIMSRISRIEEVLAEDEDDDEDFGFVELDNGLVIYKKLVERLYPHQIDGVKWMYNLFKKKKKGGILADDMGLGKTIQVISFVSAMFDMKLVKNILLVLPLSVIPNWVQEFKDWAPGIRIECFHGPASKRKAVLQQCMRKRSVCITTYGLIVTQWQALGETVNRQEFVWDYIILDEGHRIKNPSKTTKRLHSIPSRNRLILTGTPVQNKVRDLWALMDWVTQGSLLGTQRTFKSDYEIPIERARQRDATAPEIQLGNHMAESLRRLTSPFVLRRTKDELRAENKENKKPSNSDAVVDQAQDKTVIQNQPSFPKLSTKNDFVAWVYLSEIQQSIYRDFIQLDSVKALLSSHRSPLVYLTVLKKICDHPRLLSTKACRELGLQFHSDSHSSDFDSEADALEECAANRIDNISDETLIKESGKLEFLIQLLVQLRDEGHRTLVFSMSRKMLNIIQRILLNKKFKIMRLDGLVTKISEREKRVNKFQQDPSYHVFLLTTQVGGVGLTLTAADRVVIYDPSWNPASDAQSVDRIYRIGQKKSVVVYRLITCGSVEEKIYRRQIFKNSVIQQSTGGNKDPYRYFTRQDLSELFELGDVLSSSTQKQLEELHGHQRKLDAQLEKHLVFLRTLKMYGTSDHDLMFTQKPDDFDYEEQMSNDCFNNKVEQAQNRLRVESNQFTGHDETGQRWGAFVGESRPKENNHNFDINEPVYPVEGISDKFEALSLPDIESRNETRRNFYDKVSTGVEISKSPYFSHDNDAVNSSHDEDVRSRDSTMISHHDADDLMNSPNDDDIVMMSSHDADRTTPRSDITKKNVDDTVRSQDDDIITLGESPVSHASSSTSNVRENQNPSEDLQNKVADPPSDDDDFIICADSPAVSQFHKKFTPGRARKESRLSSHHGILAVDSPITKNVEPTTNNDEAPTEIEDSFTLFDEELSDENLDESWKEVFGVKPSASSTRNKSTLDVSLIDSPLVAPSNRRRQVIESEDEEQSDVSSHQSHLSEDEDDLPRYNIATLPRGRRSVCDVNNAVDDSVTDQCGNVNEFQRAPTQHDITTSSKETDLDATEIYSADEEEFDDQPSDDDEELADDQPSDDDEELADDQPSDDDEELADDRPSVNEEELSDDQPSDVEEELSDDQPSDVEEELADDQPSDVEEELSDDQPSDVEEELSDDRPSVNEEELADVEERPSDDLVQSSDDDDIRLYLSANSEEEL